MPIQFEKKVTKTFNLKYIRAQFNIRYFEDAELNGKEDTEGNMPLMDGSIWDIHVDVDTGRILSWPSDCTAKVHYKVCDAGTYSLLDENYGILEIFEGIYVPSIFYPGAHGYGDYVILNINEEGKIENWKCTKNIIEGVFSREDDY